MNAVTKFFMILPLLFMFLSSISLVSGNELAAIAISLNGIVMVLFLHWVFVLVKEMPE